MNFWSSKQRTGALTLAVGAMFMLLGCAPTTRTTDRCLATSVTFVGFSEGRGDIQQSGKVLWRGHLDDYDPSTDISAHTEVCAYEGQELLLNAGGKTYRVSLPGDRQPYFVLIDARSTDAAIQTLPFLLD